MGMKDNIEYNPKTGMDKVREFDEKILRMDSDKILLRRMAAYFFEFLIGIAVLLFCYESNWQAMHWVVAVNYSFAIKIHIDVYMIIYEEQHSISIYQLLKKIPVNPRDIFKVRLSYLWKILYKRLVIFYILQLPFLAYHNKVTVVNIVYPIAVIGIAGISCTFFIRPRQ